VGDEPRGPVQVDVVFDRFPASVRGAVVVRGLDTEPHQIRLVATSVVSPDALDRPVAPVEMESSTVDIAPHREVVLPFDIPFATLEPGSYCIVAEVIVDGGDHVHGPPAGGRRFTVPKNR
jgi:hypothetical protein